MSTKLWVNLPCTSTSSRTSHIKPSRPSKCCEYPPTSHPASSTKSLYSSRIVGCPIRLYVTRNISCSAWISQTRATRKHILQDTKHPKDAMRLYALLRYRERRSRWEPPTFHSRHESRNLRYITHHERSKLSDLLLRMNSSVSYLIRGKRLVRRYTSTYCVLCGLSFAIIRWQYLCFQLKKTARSQAEETASPTLDGKECNESVYSPYFMAES